MFDFNKLHSIKYSNSSKKSCEYNRVLKPEAPVRCGTDITVIVEKIYKNQKTSFTKF